MFTAKRAEFFELDALGLQLFILGGCVITAVARRALELNEFSHVILPSF